ncbi:hypothetical protein CIPAW_12G094600 [Carya illinoinensis]|uniref:Uncharacterized protein n=1 Tax=Carya illinoinensis TaxID=32201 RepID=A0A8T1NWT7_CARIL|nr:hypothetical protein CIPAW_12G094600 [Carya illinoinensis]
MWTFVRREPPIPMVGRINNQGISMDCLHGEQTTQLCTILSTKQIIRPST